MSNSQIVTRHASPVLSWVLTLSRHDTWITSGSSLSPVTWLLLTSAHHPLVLWLLRSLVAALTQTPGPLVAGSPHLLLLRCRMPHWPQCQGPGLSRRQKAGVWASGESNCQQSVTQSDVNLRTRSPVPGTGRVCLCQSLTLSQWQQQAQDANSRGTRNLIYVPYFSWNCIVIQYSLVTSQARLTDLLW